jgi:hypothetical protein
LNSNPKDPLDFTPAKTRTQTASEKVHVLFCLTLTNVYFACPVN